MSESTELEDLREQLWASQSRLPYMCVARGCDGCTVCNEEDKRLAKVSHHVTEQLVKETERLGLYQ